jgi:hypothetical protein
MLKNKKNRIYFLLVILLFTSCKIKQRSIKNDNIPFQSGLAYTNMSASKVMFTLNQQQNAITVNGSIRILRDSIIILSFQPFFGIEVARIAITQNEITAIDRINKQFCSVNFSSVKEQFGIDANYNMFQSIFTNSLFIFDNPKPADIALFDKVNVGELSLLQVSKKGINQEFNVDEKGKILGGRAFLDNNPYSVSWNYSNFNTLENDYSFPYNIKITVSEGNGKQQGVDLLYNKIELNKNLNFQFSIPSSYKEVRWEELMNMLQ